MLVDVSEKSRLPLLVDGPVTHIYVCLLQPMSKSGKRSHSRRGKGYCVSEDSESSASSNEGDLRAKKTKEKQSRRRSGEARRGRSVEEHRSKRERKVGGEKKSKKKRRRKGTPDMLERRDSVPLHQAKELQAKWSCLDFISSLE